jgi:RimJ/RimL family protein N-acetyltransferase
MTRRENEFGQAIGDALRDWGGAALPPRTPIDGEYCVVEPLDADRHCDDLFTAYSEDRDGRLWTYMPAGPFPSGSDFHAWMGPACRSSDPLFHALVDKASGKAVGMAAYMRIQPEVGVIEVGNIAFSPLMQKTPIATEAMFLMMRRVFDEMGYRRYEWKCDSLNDASRRAADRLGFAFEGIFRQAVVYKGRNRDTAWYSIIDSEWPALKAAFVGWLDAGNFDADGRQKKSLRDVISARR